MFIKDPLFIIAMTYVEYTNHFNLATDFALNEYYGQGMISINITIRKNPLRASTTKKAPGFSIPIFTFKFSYLVGPRLYNV